MLCLSLVGFVTLACCRGDYVDESLIGAHESVVYQKYGRPSAVGTLLIHPDSSYMGVRSPLPYIIRKRGATDFTELGEIAYSRDDGVQMRVWTIETEKGDVVIDNIIWPPCVVY